MNSVKARYFITSSPMAIVSYGAVGLSLMSSATTYRLELNTEDSFKAITELKWLPLCLFALMGNLYLLL